MDEQGPWGWENSGDGREGFEGREEVRLAPGI